MLQRTDLISEMEITEAHEDRQKLIMEKRKWQSELENKRHQLEDDRRALQHLKSKALRERWLLDGLPTTGPEREGLQRQVEEDQVKTRRLEESISRLEQELSSLETGTVCEKDTHKAVMSQLDTAVEVTCPVSSQMVGVIPSSQVIKDPSPIHCPPTNVKVHKSPHFIASKEAAGEMKKAMYSLEITVERDKVTGETRVLSTNTRLPVDLSDQGVKVYEDEQKVVHEVNGEEVHLLSSSEVDELIHKADEASMLSQSVVTVTSLPAADVRRESDSLTCPVTGPVKSPKAGLEEKPAPAAAVEITGLEAKAGGELSIAEASVENPVTMVFMGYQDVEDEDETKKVLGLQGTVKAELVLIDDAAEVKVDSPPPTASMALTSTKPPEAGAVTNGETAGEVREVGVVVKKEKQPCKCCSIM